MKIDNPLYTNEIQPFEMNGTMVYRFGSTNWEYLVQSLSYKYSEEELKKMYLISHQGSGHMLDTVIKKYALLPELVYNGVKEYGCCSQASTFVGLDKNFDKRPEKILLSAYGAELQR
jgi:3-oxoacyl-[acyl-carrier-protein] synthase III